MNYPYQCDICARVGTTDDGIAGDDTACPADDCDGRVHLTNPTTYTLTVTIGPFTDDNGFIDYLIGEIWNAIESTDIDGLDVTVGGAKS